jgi:hypothetical protein
VRVAAADREIATGVAAPAVPPAPPDPARPGAAIVAIPVMRTGGAGEGLAEKRRAV